MNSTKESAGTAARPGCGGVADAALGKVSVALIAESGVADKATELSAAISFRNVRRDDI
jgi:hypothetical protein